MTIIQELLRDNYSSDQAFELQIKYQSLCNQIPEHTYLNEIKSIETIVGVDISYFKKENYEFGVACAVVWDFKQDQLRSHYLAKDRIIFPYKSGFLGFRECKLLAKVISKFSGKIDLIMCDGHGKIHPRRFGEAVQLGFALNIPSIGIAKTYYGGYLETENIKKIKGYKSLIWAKDPNKLLSEQSNEILGYFVCLNKGSKPVYISAGYKIALDLALKVCLNTTNKHRQPEPLYLADFLSREELKKQY